MHIMVIGLRGFPDVQGGIESHAEKLYPLLARWGCDVEVLVRTPYHPPGKSRAWRSVRFRPLWAPRICGLEAFVHSLLGTVYAALKRPDILHIHAVGPALMTPLASLLGLKVVITHHGPDYDREKWSRFARWVLRTGERLGVRYANECIVISDVIRDIVKTRYGRDAVTIRNGVDIPGRPDTDGALKAFGLRSGRYVLQVSRFVPEKRQLDLVRAFGEAKLEGWHLVLVGGLDTLNAYTRQIMERVREDPRIVLTGFQTGLALRELYGHAGVFVLPSSHEGLPIALLEALSFGLPVIASDIPANTEIGLPSVQYFRLGDTAALADGIRRLTMEPIDDAARDRIRGSIAERYNWEAIAQQTLAVYRRAASHAGARDYDRQADSDVGTGRSAVGRLMDDGWTSAFSADEPIDYPEDFFDLDSTEVGETQRS